MQAEKSQKQAKPSKASIPKPTYQDKYNHILKSEVGKDAAATIVTNKQFGNGRYCIFFYCVNVNAAGLRWVTCISVKLENKQDRRTIEQTLADRRVKKQKLEQTGDNQSSSQDQGSSSNL